MKVNQIYTLLNNISSQMFGENAIEVNDLSGIISLGNNVLSSSDNTDLFINKLVDRIGKTVVRTLDLELEFPTLYMNEFEFGAILSKINVQPMDAIENNEYNVGKNDFVPSYDKIYKPVVFVSYFEGASTWKFQCTIPDDMLKSAFTSESAMGNFITAITSAMSDSMTIKINQMTRTAFNNLIAEKIISGKNVINLLDMYNTAYGLTGDNALDMNEAMVSKEFYRYACNIIRKYVKYLSEPSALYNNGDGNGNSVVRATSRDNMHVLMSTDFAAGVDSYLYSDSFHYDVFDMPLFTEIPYFQGNVSTDGENTFKSNSTINVIPSSQEKVAVAGNRYAVNQSGIVCVLADRQALAVGLNRRRTGTFYNSIDAYTNLSSSAFVQWYNDLSENTVVFLVADSVATPSISFDKSTLTFANSSAADQTITATTTPNDATVTWKTSKSAVATVSNGVVSPAGTGDCVITGEITVGGVKYTATASVTVG